MATETCTGVGSMPAGHIFDSKTLNAGQTQSGSCADGYTQSSLGVPTRVCNSTGNWQMVCPSCVKKEKGGVAWWVWLLIGLLAAAILIGLVVAGFWLAKRKKPDADPVTSISKQGDLKEIPLEPIKPLQ